MVRLLVMLVDRETGTHLVVNADDPEQRTLGCCEEEALAHYLELHLEVQITRIDTRRYPALKEQT